MEIDYVVESKCDFDEAKSLCEYFFPSLDYSSLRNVSLLASNDDGLVGFLEWNFGFQERMVLHNIFHSLDDKVKKGLGILDFNYKENYDFCELNEPRLKGHMFSNFYISKLAASTEVQNQGLGSEILVWSLVNDENPSFSFWEKNGFFNLGDLKIQDPKYKSKLVSQIYCRRV